MLWGWVGWQMAIATLTAPLALFGDEDKRRSMSRKLYGSARKAMNIAQALQRDNVDIVMAGLLIARYLCVFLFLLFHLPSGVKGLTERELVGVGKTGCSSTELRRDSRLSRRRFSWGCTGMATTWG